MRFSKFNPEQKFLSVTVEEEFTINSVLNRWSWETVSFGMLTIWDSPGDYTRKLGLSF